MTDCVMDCDSTYWLVPAIFILALVMTNSKYHINKQCQGQLGR